ncbi:MAG: hypothetical protein IPI46_03940 [Bacteroidetes bacterium]|nr:hypothetical protein [Bacteroidota bacterium]
MKSCLACNKVLKGRVDKKFCDDTCRNGYNNLLRADTSNYTRNIIHALQKNRRILESFLGSEEMVKAKKEQLIQAGFYFKYHTHSATNKKGNIYYFCFEYAYLSLEHDWFLVVRKRE